MTTQNPRKIVIFFGVDGAGKSTQTAMLLKEMKNSGFKTRKAWIRARHNFAFFFSQIILKLGYKSFFTRQKSAEKILDTRNLPAKWLWSLIEFVSVIPLIIIRVYIPLLLGYYVVAERYVIDTIVYNRFFIGDPFNFYAKILIRLLPKKALLVHLDANKQDIFLRRKDDVLPKSFLQYQLEQYRLIALSFSALSINTSINDATEVNKVLRNALNINPKPYRETSRLP